ncbi:MAG: PAS domain S-box protein [Sedimenticola sp.]|nr:PAS domain S-box protein [Sedimenticola sp.]
MSASDGVATGVAGVLSGCRSGRLIRLLALLFCLYQSQVAAAETQQHHVLLINSYHQGMSWVEAIHQAVKDEFTNSDVILQLENMDSKQYHSEDYFRSLARHYSEKYKNTPFDLILATDNNAYDFLREHRSRLFPDVPVVFSGVNDFREEQIAGMSQITGVAEQFDARGTVVNALKLFPETQQIYIINDYLKTGRAWVREIKRQLKDIGPSVNMIYSDDLTLDEQKQLLGQLPDKSLVLLGVYFSDQLGYHSTYEKIGAELAEASRLPVFCLLEFNIGSRVVGGNVISGYSQGQLMAQLGKRILQGESAQSIAVVTQGSNRFVFDFNALQHWRVDVERLPQGALIVNEPWSFYKAYRSQIWAAVIFILLLLSIISALFMSIRKRIRIEADLRQSKQRFEGIFNQTFQFIGLLTPEGYVLDANMTALKSSEIELDEILGRHFCDTPWLSHSEKERKKMQAAIRAAAAGEFVRYEVTHQTATGRLIEMDFSLKPVFNDKGEVTLLIPEGRDVSDLKEAQSALEQSSNLLKRVVEDQQFLLDNINDFIYRHDLAGHFEYVSPSIRQITGYTPDQWAGHYVDTLTSSPINQRVSDYTEEALTTGIPHAPYEIEVRHKSGKLIRLEISERPYKKAGDIVGMIGVARDVTDRAAAEAALQELNRFQKTILENADVWLAVYDAQGDIAIWNKTAQRISGYSREEVQSRQHIMTLLYPEPGYREQVWENVLPAIEGKQPLDNYRSKVVCKDGSVRCMVWNTRALDGAKGTRGSVTIGLDITEQERASREAMELRNYLQNVINSMPSVLVAVDQKGRVVQWNTAAEAVTGKSLYEVKGRALDEVFTRFIDDMATIFSSIETGEPSMGVRRMRTTENATYYEDISIYPLAGDVQGAVIRVDDVTERVRIEEMIIQSEKMLSVGGLAAGMAHEINNPLAGVLQNMQVMKNRFDLSLPKNQLEADACQISLEGLSEYLERRGIHKMMESVTRSGLRAARIVENMLSFSRKSTLEYAPQNLARLVDSTIELAANDYDLKKNYDFRKIEIVRNYQPELPDVPCESGQIQQVILNILKNGAHAMAQNKPQGGVSRFEIGVDHDREGVQVSITDNGPGMSPAVLKRVFEPFFTTKQVGVGTGLGLSVSYFIITENHKGSMTVHALPGQGARFTFKLPIKRPG